MSGILHTWLRADPSRESRSIFALVALAAGGLNLALLARPPHPMRYLAAFALLWLVPGVLWSFLLAQRESDLRGDEVVVGLGLGFSSSALLTLLLNYLPGPLNGVHLLVAANVQNLLLVVFAGPRTRSIQGVARRFRPRTARHAWGWVFLFLLTMGLRFINLSYSEFQGDEAVIMVRAARALEGDDGALFMHQKGPAEILIPMATWRLSGTIDEFWARAPFALAAVAGVLAVAVLGWRLFERRAGWLAGWLLALSGYHVGFGRIVQYQSLVLLATAAALLALWRWGQGDRNAWLFSGAALLAFAALCHYDAAMALPPALYLVLLRFRSVRNRAASLAGSAAVGFSRQVGAAGLLGIALLALFYLPYLFSASLTKTLGYLSGERVGTGGPIYNNLGSSLILTTVYNSTWYVLVVVLLVVAAGLTALRGRGRLVLVALVLAAVWGSLRSSGSVVPFVALSFGWALVAFSRQVSNGFRMAWLWFGVPFLLFHFVIWDPRTHVLNLFPGACLVAAFALTRIGQAARSVSRARRMGERLWRRLAQPLRLSSGAMLFVGFAALSYYPVWMFVDHTPEVLRTWPAHRHPLYPTVYDEIPAFGLFGFPYRAGWKAIGSLYDAGMLAGSYASNEEVEVTGWYTRGAERTYCPGPDVYIVAERVQDEMPLDWGDLAAHYQEAAGVSRGTEVLLRLYVRDAPGEAPTFPLAPWVGPFDAGTTPGAVLPPPPEDYVPVGAELGGQVRLLGYRLDPAPSTPLAPGDSVQLTLYWEALIPLRQHYHVFTHLYADGEMWGQADSVPQCGLWPTMRWQPGEVVPDRHELTLRADTPAGSIPLTVGMYTLPDGTRVPVHSASGEPLGDALQLTTIEVLR